MFYPYYGHRRKRCFCYTLDKTLTNDDKTATIITILLENRAGDVQTPQKSEKNETENFDLLYL